MLVLGIRFYGKGLLRQILGLDDYIMLAAMVFALPVTIFPMVGLNFGLGLHIWDLKSEWHTPYWKVRHAMRTRVDALLRLMKFIDGLYSRPTLPHGMFTHQNLLVFNISESLSRTFDQDFLLYYEYLCVLLYCCMYLHVTLSVRSSFPQPLRRCTNR